MGLQAEGLQSLLAERAAVDAEVQSLIGMSSLKAFLKQMRAKVEFVGRGAAPIPGARNLTPRAVSPKSHFFGLLHTHHSTTQQTQHQ